MGLLDAWKSDEQKEQEKRERLAPQYQRLKSAYQKMVEADPSARDEQTEALFSKYDSVFAGVKTPEQKIHEQISAYNENVQQTWLGAKTGEPIQRGIGLAGEALSSAPRLIGAMAGALPQGILNMGPRVAEDLNNIAAVTENLAGRIKGAPAAESFARSPQGIEYLDPRRWAMLIGEQGPLTVALGAAYVANPVLGQAIMFGVEGGETLKSLDEYEKQTGQPIHPNVKLFAAIAVGAINAKLESLGFEAMLGRIPGLKSKIAKALLGGTAGEGITEGLQEINQMLAEYYGADAPLFTPENWDRLKQSVYAGIVLGFAGGAGTQVGEMAAERRNQGMKNKETPYQPGEQPQEDLRQAGQIGPGEAPGSPRIDAMTDPPKTILEGESAQQTPESVSGAPATEPTLEEPAMSEMERKRAELLEKTRKERERAKRRQQVIDQSGTQTEAERIEQAQREAQGKPKRKEGAPAKTVREWVRRKGRISSQGLKEYGFGEGSRENQNLLLQIGSQNGAGVDELAQQAIDEGVIPPPPADTNPADWFMQQVKDDALTQDQQLADLERQAQERESGGETLPPLPKEKPIRSAKDLQQRFISEMNLPEDQAAAAASVYDAVAGAWAKANGKSKADWYKDRIAGVQQRGNPDIEDVLFQFAGPESETADKHALTTAKKLIEDGIRPSEVRRKTGWFKGLDGKWRYEISDNDSSLNEAEYEKLKDNDEIYLSDLLEHDKLYAAYPAFRVTPVRIDNSRNGAVFYPKSGWIETQKEGLTPKQFRSVLLHEIQHIIQTQEGFASGGNTQIAPQIKNALGYLVEDKNLEILKWEDENGQTIKEAQDAAKMLRNAYLYRDAQKLFDYANHDRPSSLRRHILSMGQWLYDPIFKDASEDIQKRADELQRRIYNMPKRHKMQERNQFLRDYTFDLAQLLRDLIPPNAYQQFKNDPRKLTSFVKAFERQYSRAQAKLKPRGKKVRELQAVKRTKEATEFKTPFQIYEALYGEIEARNTQARADMTDEERRDTSPERTQDVPNEEAIIFYNGKSVQAPMMANLKGRDVLYQEADPAPIFYSKLSRIIDEKMGGAANPQQLMAMIKKAGVKDEEIEWSGLDQLLEGKNKVSKEEVQGWLEENSVQVEEVLKGAPDPVEEKHLLKEKERVKKSIERKISETPELRSLKVQLEAAQEIVSLGTASQEDVKNMLKLQEKWMEVSDRLLMREKGRLREIENQLSAVTPDTKYSEYALPGAENYRELLLTIPDERTKDRDRRMDQIEKRLESDDVTETERDELVKEYFDLSDMAQPDKAQGVYRSSHFDEPNILAHVRFNERTGPNGEKILFIEEIQSDWHQAGRKKGYKPRNTQKPDMNGYVVETTKSNEWTGQRDINIKDPQGKIVSRRSGFRGTDAEALEDHAQARVEEAKKRGVPDAPFKTTWHELAFKRMMRWAAENGFDTIAWTTGEQQAQRYDLSKQIKYVSYSPKNQRLIADAKGGEQVINQQVSPEKLDEYIGKELAEKLLNQPVVNRSGTDVQELAGVDLKVGGEGMKAFYDRMLVNTANKLGKKYGARVSQSQIETDSKTIGELGEGEDLRTAKNKADAHSIPVTDQMRFSLLNEGMPLFQRKKGAVQFLQDGRAIIHAFNQADVSTALHELAHIFRRDLSPEDQQVVLDWAGADSFTTEVEEKFARAFERYLYEGKAPNAKLKAIFEKLKAWMREIYTQLKGSAIDIEISPEIRDIFDRVLTGEAFQQQQKPTATKNPGAQESGRRPTSGRYDVGDYAVTNPSIMNMPEIVELAKSINAGRVPRIRERLAARSAQGVFKPGSGRIELLAQLFKDPERAKRTLAHEIGHLVDWLPDENLSRGNILGRIASLKKHMKHMLVEHVGSIYNVITPEERERLRKEARAMTRGRGPKAAKEKYQDLLQKEIKRRGLFDLKKITAELKDLTHIWKPFDATSDPKYTKYRYKSEELYADAFSVLLNDPALLREVAPTFYRAFFNYIDAKPEVKRVYDEIQRRINNPEELYEDRRQRVRKSQAKGSEAKQHEAKSIRERAFDQLIDANGPLLRRIRKAEKAGKEIAPDDNPRYWIEKLPYISSQINQYLRDIDKMVVKVAEDAGLSMADLGELMFYRRIAYGDRGKLANPLGFTPEDALANMGYMRQKMTAQQWDALTKAVEAFRAIREEQILPFLRKSGMYSDELIELLESSQHYSTFDIFHHRLQQIGGTEPRVNAITGQIHKQIGTFSETSNPFIATIMKDAALIRAASRKMASEKMIKFLVQEGEAVPAELYYNGKFMAPKRPKNPDYELLAYMDKGKIVGYWVPKDIEKLINKELQRFDGVGEIFGKIMRPVKEAFVGKNPFWAYWNAQRDFWGFLTKVPEAKMFKFIKVLAQSVPDAYRDAFLGESTEYVKQMYIDREIISGRHWDARERGSSENELDVMLKSFGIRPAPAKNWRRALNFLLDALEKPGQFTERWVKIAGKKYLQQYTAYTPEEISHIVRVRAGSPDFYRRGEWYHAYNNLFLFGNAGKEGLRSAIEGYRSSKGAFVWRMVQYNMLPKLVMRLAEAGLIGAIWSGLSGDDEEDIQEYFKAIPDYDKTNYHIIPMGRSENGIPIYLRFPLDFTGQIFGALFWKFTGALQKKDLEEMKEIPAIVYGGLPYSSINPVPMVGSNWMQYLVFDNNPYDYFYGEHVISQKAFKARDHRALLDLTWHSFNMLGGGMIYKRPSIYDPDPVTPFEKMLRAPVVGPAMQRLVKVSDAGIRQEARKQTDKEERIKNRNSLRLDEDIQDHLKSLTVDPSLADANKLWNKLKEDNPEAGKFPAFKRKYFRFVISMSGSSIEKALSRANTWIKRKNVLEAYLGEDLTADEAKERYKEIMGKYNPKGKGSEDE